MRATEYEFPEVKIDRRMVEIAGTIMERQAGRFEPAQFIDRYQEALRELIKAKAAGRGPAKTKAPVIQGNVVDLMDALRRSLKSDSPGAQKPSQGGKRVGKGDKRQQGLLLPIKGDSTGKAEPATRATRRRA